MDYKAELAKLEREEKKGEVQDVFTQFIKKKRKTPLDIDSDDEDDVPTRQKRPRTVSRSPPSVTPPSEDEVKNFRVKLSQSPPTVEIVQILNKLLVFKMTIKTLKATKIGVAVNKLRKHSDLSIAKPASVCIKRWKALIK